MDRLIDALTKAKAIIDDGVSVCDMMDRKDAEQYLDAQEAIDAALAALQREQWVPLSERLPEKEQYPVLVAHRSGAVRMVFGIEPFIDGDWMGYYEPTLQGRFLRGITHWMPLPPAPQTEEKP